MVDDISLLKRSISRKIILFLFFFFVTCSTVNLLSLQRISINLLGSVAFIKLSTTISFFSGLGAGVLFAKFGSARFKKEIHFFIFSSTALGVMLIIYFAILPVVTVLANFIFQKTLHQFLIQNIFYFLILFFLTFFPSALIGCSLTAIFGFLTKNAANIAQEIKVLAVLFTTSIALSIFLSDFAFFQIIGTKQIFGFSAFSFLIISTVTRFFTKNFDPSIYFRYESSYQQLQLPFSAQANNDNMLDKAMFVCAAMLSFLFVSLLLLWMRIGVYFYGTTNYALSFALMSIFIGLAIGLYFADHFFPETIPCYPVLSVIIILFGVIGISSFFVMPVLKNINHIIHSLLDHFSFWLTQLTVFTLNTLLIYIFPAALFGIAITLICQIIIKNEQNLTRNFDLLKAFIFGGAAAGIFITEFIIIAIFGVQKSIILISLLYFLFGLIILFIYSIQFGKIKRTSLVFIFVVFLFIFILLIPSNTILRIYNSIGDQIHTFYVTEVMDGTLTLYINEKTNQIVLAQDGETIAEKPLSTLAVDEVSGLIPMLLHPNANSLLLLGMDSGQCSKMIRSYPIDQIEFVESSNKKIELFKILNENEKEVGKRHNTEITRSDKTRFSKFRKKEYDVIINRSLHPATKSAANQFSVDYYKNCKKLLSPTGIFVTLVPLYGLSIEDLKIILKTFLRVFPHSTVWYNNNKINYHILLIGFNDSIFQIDFKQFSKNFDKQKHNPELTQAGFSNVYDVFDCFVMGHEEIETLTKGLRINTVNRPLLEFSTPKTPRSPKKMCRLLQLLKSYREEIYPYLTNIDSSYQKREFVELVTDTYFKSSEKVFDGLCEELRGNEDDALRYYQQAIAINGLEYGAKRFLDAYFDPLLFRNPNTPPQFMRNAKIYYQKTEYQKAIESLQQAIEMDPNYAPAYFGLGMNYETLGELEKAKEMYQKTLLLKPDLENVKNRLDAVNKELE